MMAQEPAQQIELVLPTDNEALFAGGGPEFYQYIDRDYQGVKTTPWEGGQYGFVRNPVPTSEGIVYSRFHEGIDIRPVQRDARGEPLDEVRAIANGTVVHTNLVPRYSSYGNYIVIEHEWGGSNYYSLYGHLRLITARPGQQVRRGETIGIMGYTGAGLNQARAHLHLEINLLLSRNFQGWHDHFIKTDPNRHGIYNGINLSALDVAKFYLALQKQPALTIPEFLAEEEIFYKVIVPNSDNFDLPKLYPWMVRKTGEEKIRSWEVSFNRSGIPLRIEGESQKVKKPTLSYTKKSSVDYAHLTRGNIGGRGSSAQLTKNGEQLMRLFTFPD